MISRRTAITSAVGLSAVAALAACAPASETVTPSPSATAPQPQAQEPVASVFVVAAAADVPVGSGKKYAAGDIEVFITQPRAGEFRAFNATCTHAGCAVGSLSDGAIICPCHGAKYDHDTGAVLQGPATRALGKAKISVIDGMLEVSY